MSWTAEMWSVVEQFSTTVGGVYFLMAEEDAGEELAADKFVTVLLHKRSMMPHVQSSGGLTPTHG